MNLANKLTLSRIFLVPVFMIFILPIPDWIKNLDPRLMSIDQFIMNSGNYIASVIFIIASITDGVDGYVARKRKQITKFGKFLDPIADKLLITAALIALVQRGEAAGWAAMVIIGREFMVTGLRLIAAGEGVVIAAGIWGKIKMVSQIIAIVASLVKFNLYGFDKWSMFIAVVLTIYSGYEYIAKNVNLIDYK